MSTDQNEVTCTGPPRRFLRKGEGLKRFAAYKPPLPSTVKKVERRQTFVRFKMDLNKSSVEREPAHFIPPEILNDDSINLSTEIPKIAPPKIMHTPIRPNRQPLSTIRPNGQTIDPPSSPSLSPKNFILALGRQIQQIEATVNELKDKVKSCECGAFGPPPAHITRRRPTTRSSARAAKAKASDNNNTRPSADADNTPKEINNLVDKISDLRSKLEGMQLRR